MYVNYCCKHYAFLRSNLLLKIKSHVALPHVFYRNKYCDRNILKLSERGMYENIFPETSSNEIIQIFNRKPQHVYAGFDPTASSLHVGNLLILMNLLHWQRGGHKVIILIGGATVHIGDPSGHSKDRTEVMTELVTEYAHQIQNNIIKVFDNHEKYFWKNIKNASPLQPIIIVNNQEWYRKIKMIDFLSKIGRHFRMGSMLLKESVSKRMKSDVGMSFTEFTYQIFQAYDWLYLFENYDCRFQIGGKDQMGNIVAGHNLIGRVVDQPVYGLTLPLVTNQSGDKFGKSVRNAVWLDEKLTSPFDFYQFFWRTPDDKVEELLKLFTFLPIDHIENLMEKQRENPKSRIPHTKLAEEVTKLVHGEEGLKSAKMTSSILYSNNLDELGSLSIHDLTNVLEGAVVVDLPMKAGYSILRFALDIPCFADERDALRIMNAGGFSINLQKVLNPYEVVSHAVHILPNNITIVRVGKKQYYIVRWET